jgi:hypothetical protein
MVPYFYGSNDASSEDTQSLLLELEAQFGHPDASSFQEMKAKFQRKISEQCRITGTGYDAQVLNLAINLSSMSNSCESTTTKIMS